MSRNEIRGRESTDLINGILCTNTQDPRKMDYSRKKIGNSLFSCYTIGHPRQTPLRHENAPLRMPLNFAHLFMVLFWIYSRLYCTCRGNESSRPYNCGVWKGRKGASATAQMHHPGYITAAFRKLNSLRIGLGMICPNKRSYNEVIPGQTADAVGQTLKSHPPF
jgi:hypothetical protein